MVGGRCRERSLPRLTDCHGSPVTPPKRRPKGSGSTMSPSRPAWWWC